MKINIRLKKLGSRGFSHDIGIVIFAVIFGIAGVAYLVASHADTCAPTGITAVKGVSSPTCTPVSGPTSGEQLTFPPQPRPSQYVHICTTSTSNSTKATTYITQGTPNCLLNGTFKGDYGSNVAGTYYNVPCGAISNTSTRYVYISSTERCPAGTVALKAPTLAPGEQLSKPPARRPAQYVHICTVATSNSTKATTYITQGTPNCLLNGTFKGDYAPSVPGTYYNVPCQSTSNSLIRYAYIAVNESCPAGTVAVQ